MWQNNIRIKVTTVLMKGSNGSIFRVTVPLWGEFAGLRLIPLSKASDAELDVFFGLRPNKRLSKQPRRRWFETSSRPLSRHCNYKLWSKNDINRVNKSTHSVHGLLNTLRPRQNGRHFADDRFKGIFLNENAWISFKISLKFVPKVRINNIPALVPIMAWRR